MNLRQLNYFVKIVELKNMTQAAKSLYIAQPALSQQMTALEEKLGVKLLVRKPRGVEPTAEGRLLYSQAKSILRQIESIHTILSHKDQQLTGTVSVAMASSTARMLGLPLIKSVRKNYPAIQLEIIDIPSADLYLIVSQGRVDIALPPDQENYVNLSTTPLIIEDLLVFTNPSLKIDKEVISLTDLSEIPLLLPSQPNKLRMRIDYAFLNALLPYKLIAQLSTSALLIPAVCENLGATILPYSAAFREIKEGAVKAHYLEPKLTREISICTSNNATVRPEVKAIWNEIYNLTATMILNGTWKHCRLAKYKNVLNHGN